MKKSFYLLLLLSTLACNKNKDDGSVLLREITADFGHSQTYEYAGGLLVKENTYHKQFCATPIDEVTYIYQNGKLDHTETTMRSLYSSSAALCDPASGIRTQEAFEYDGQGRLSKVTRTHVYSVFLYNADNRVEKVVFYNLNGTIANSVVFTYDLRGNIIKEDDANNGISLYEYDNKKNPLYRMKSRPDMISAFTSSPNNPIKGTGNFSFERKILTYTHDMPYKVNENGVIYTYKYQ